MGDPNLKLIPQQQQAHDQLLNYLTGNLPYPAAVLTGFAGTGKTTTVNTLIGSLLKYVPARMIGVAAPTHKAVKILRRSAVEGVEYRTIHSMLGLREVINPDTGEIDFQEDKYRQNAPIIEGLRILMIDEASMLRNDLFKKLVPYQHKGLKVLYIGDRAQIPPVNEPDCIPFKYGKEWNFLFMELTEPIRQEKDSPLLEWATEIRNNYKDGIFHPREKLLEDGTGIKLIQGGTELEMRLLYKYFGHEKFKEDPDFFKVIAWTNNTVHTYNQTIRKLLYGQEAQRDYLPGEKLVMSRPFMLPSNKIISNNEELVIVNSRASTKVLSYKTTYGIEDSISFPIYLTEVHYEQDGLTKSSLLPLIQDIENRQRLWRFLNQMADDILKLDHALRGKFWKQYYNIRDSFAHVGYNYAITAHKSQGSTYENALVIKSDLDCNPIREERNRILYTAVTRTSNTLFIVP